MLEILRKHGLVAFMLALALVSLVQRQPAVAALMTAITIEELQRRGMAPAVRALEVVRWCCVLLAVGLMLRAA